MAGGFKLVGLGEALFDIFPDRQVLGGAPLNVAVHAHQLAQPLGGRGLVVSRIGQDDLGQQVLQDLSARGMDCSYVQSDPDHGTGRVYVGTDERGDPTFEVADDAAWDWIQFDPDLESLARSCQAVCFGSLAQRGAQARNSIYRFLDGARGAVRLFDVNLRMHFYDQWVLARSCELATVVKLNDAELSEVAGMFHLDRGAKDAADRHEARARALLKRFKLKMVVVTRGPEGTVLYTEAGRFEGQAVSYEAREQADAVGAGDACTAALLVGLLRRWPMPRVVDLANHAGAYVASVPGATPQLPQELLDMARG